MNTVFIRKIFLLALFCSVGRVPFAQVIQLHCFRQDVNGGTINTQPGGKNLSLPSRYFIVIETGKNKVHVSSARINGIVCSFTCEPVERLPLILPNSNGDAMINQDTLIRSSPHKVFLLKNLAPAGKQSADSKARQQYPKDVISITYTCQNVLRTIRSSKIKNIKPLITQ